MKILLLACLLFFAHSSFGQKKVTLNRIQKDSVRFYIGFQKITEQFNYLQAAQKFSVDKNGSILQQVDLYRAILPFRDGFAAADEPDSTTFLVRIYDVDSLTGSPGASLISEPLTIRNSSNSLIKIDLSKEKIIIPGKTFFVGIEWLFNLRNQRNMTDDPDRSAQGTHDVVSDRIYQPFIGMVKNNKHTSDAWVMTPEHKWMLYTHNLPYMTDLSISAHMLVN
ncbi:hypothetical protein ACVWYN_001514 [Pedobacter sp. UYP24]